MPNYDGFDACRRLRERSDVPIIWLSALLAGAGRVARLRVRRADGTIAPDARRLAEQDSPGRDGWRPTLRCGDLY